jgi:hypothetical protein
MRIKVTGDDSIAMAQSLLLLRETIDVVNKMADEESEEVKGEQK